MDHHYYSLSSGSEICFHSIQKLGIADFLSKKSNKMPWSYNISNPCTVKWHSLSDYLPEIWYTSIRSCSISSKGKLVTAWISSSIFKKLLGVSFRFLLARINKSKWKTLPESLPPGFSQLRAPLGTLGKCPRNDLNLGFIKKGHAPRLLYQDTSHSLCTVNHL